MNYLLGQQLVFILGITNVISFLLILLTCRCLVGFKFLKKPLVNKFFSKLYKWHCIYWIIFILSVLAHTILAFRIYGNPF